MAKILTRFTVHHHLAMQLIVEVDRGGIGALGLLSNAAGSVLSNQQKGQANSHDSYSHAKQALDRLGANIFIENVACSKSRRDAAAVLLDPLNNLLDIVLIVITG